MRKLVVFLAIGLLAFSSYAQVAEVKGDYNGDGLVDIFYQAKTYGERSRLAPYSGADIAGFHISWTNTHPDIRQILDWSERSYFAYAGDIDSSPGDELLLLGKQQPLILHGDVTIPILIFPRVKNAIVSWNSNGLPSFNEFDLNLPQSIQLEDYDVMFGDTNDDGNNEIVLKTRVASGINYVLDADGNYLRTIANNEVPVEIPLAIDPLNDPLNDPRSNPKVFKGYTQGSYSTNPFGEFEYYVPIKAPEGINGIQPSLSLDYNSINGNSVAGWGWNLTGTSVISRCKATLIRDGYLSGVLNEDEYKYCLDGQRLVEVGDNEYRFENEKFAKITYDATANTWTLYGPSGVKKAFGTLPNSSLDDSSGETYKWSITLLEDQYGNYAEYKYSDSSEFLQLSQIDYTKNRKKTGSGHQIKLSYESRGDLLQTYQSGNKEVVDQRLKAIYIQKNNRTFRRFNIDYYINDQAYDGNIFNDPLNVSRVRSIKECFTSDTDCAEPIIFRFGDMSPNISKMEDPGSPAPGSMVGFLPGVDITFASANYYDTVDEAYRLEDDIPSNMYGVGVLLPKPGYKPLKGLSVRGDFDGDNKQEVAWWECTENTQLTSSKCTHYVQMSKLATPQIVAENVPRAYTYSPISNTTGSIGSSLGQVIDINGDGLDDYLITAVYGSSHGYQIYLSDGDQLVYSDDYSLTKSDLSTYGSVQFDGDTYNGRYGNVIELEDINGDGLLDVFKTTTASSTEHSPIGLVNTGYDKIEVAINNGSGFDNFSTWGKLSDYSALANADFTSSSYVNIPYLADVNGDGRKDVLSFFPTLGIQVGINTGNSFTIDHSWADSWPALISDLENVVDNQFGQQYYQCPYTTIRISGAAGTGSYYHQLISSHGSSLFAPVGGRDYGYERNMVKYGDYNGDSLTDIAYLSEQGIYVALSTGTSFESPKLWTDKITMEQVSCGIQTTVSDPGSDIGAFSYHHDFQSWEIADINGDGKTDIQLYVLRHDKELPQRDLNQHFALYSSSSELDGLHFTEPQKLHEYPYEYHLTEDTDILSQLTQAENGELVFSYAIRLPSLPDKNPYDPYIKENMDAYSAQHLKIAEPWVKSVEFNGGATSIEIEYSKIISNSHAYIQSSVDSTAELRQGNSNDSRNTYTSLNARNNSYRKASQLSNRANASIVVKSLIEYHEGDLSVDKSFSYQNQMSHRLGYGNLGFETVVEFQKRGTGSDLRGKYFNIVSDYYQIANNGFVLAGTPKSRRIYATDNQFDDEEDYIQDILIKEELFDRRVVLFSDDHDPELLNPDYADYQNKYLHSPHYFSFVLYHQTKSFDFESGNLIGKSLEYFQNNDSESLRETTCYEITELQLSKRLSRQVSIDDYFDSYGNPSRVIEKKCDEFGVSGKRVVNSNILNVVSNNWLIGLVQNPGETFWNYDSTAGTTERTSRESSVSFGSQGKIESETFQPNDSPEFWLEKKYSYNDYGSVEMFTETVKNYTNDGIDFTSRVTDIMENYDSGYRVVQIINPLGHTTTTRTDTRYSVDVYYEDVNGLATNTSLDSYGRYAFITYPDGNNTQYDYRECNSCFSYELDAKYYAQIKTTGQSAQRVYFDSLDRVVGSRTKSLTGDNVYSYVTYNALGNVVRTSNTFFGINDLAETTIEYDIFNRVVKSTFPNGGVERSVFGNAGDAVYSANLVTKIDSLGNITRRQKDMSGRDMVVTDMLGTSVHYRYDGLSNISRLDITKKSSSYSRQSYAIDYDVYGRKTKLTDPNIGFMEYKYNGLSLLVESTNALNQVTQYSYDKLNRMAQRIDDATNEQADKRTHTWTYDNRTNGVGSVGDVSGYDSDGNSYKKEYSYTQYGLVNRATTRHSGQEFPVKYLYNNFNQFAGYQLHDGYAVTYKFNSQGHKDEVSDNKDKLLWKALDSDALGNITRYRYGNDVETTKSFDHKSGLIDTINATKGSIVVQNHNYDFDTEGNLRKRDDLLQSAKQLFCYDQLYRLTDYDSVSCNDATTRSFTGNKFRYDILGNIFKKEGIDDYRYGESAGPNAVTYANGSSYTYDDAGQMTSGGGRSILYTSFGKPKFMHKNGYSTSITYDSEFNRVKRVDEQNGAVTTTFYINNLTEIVSKSNENLKIRHFIDDFAIYQSSGDITEVVYLHKDHLGSIVAKTSENIQDNTDIIFQANDPWGRRQENSWNGEVYDELTGRVLDSNTYGTNRGFTEHEHLDGVGLIHMNGRVYDPIVGRFLSPDPLIQAPTNTQSFNRYSYVWNNPLRYTDPTGYEVEGNDSGEVGLPIYEIIVNEAHQVDNSGRTDSRDGSRNYSGFSFSASIYSKGADVTSSYTRYGDFYINWANVQNAVYAGLGTMGLDADMRRHFEGNYDLLQLALADYNNFTEDMLNRKLMSDALGSFSGAGGGSMAFIKSIKSVFKSGSRFKSMLNTKPNSSVTNGGVLNAANYAQKTFGKNFSAAGKFASQTVDDVAKQLSSGKLKPSDVPIDYITRNGNTLILNTRSSQALTQAGIPRSQWNAVNRTGQDQFEAMLSGQLKRNKLTDIGISTVRQSGGR